MRAPAHIRQSLPLPLVLGSDASGEVAAIGAGVTGFRIGERVIPMPGYALAGKDYDFKPISRLRVTR